MQKLDIKPVKNKKAYFQIIETLINLIINGQLEYGEKLYNEAELMEILNVSRPTLREALRVMEFLDIVTVAPRKGIVINDPKDNKEYFPLIYILTFEKTSKRSLFELRRSIELEMVGFAALRGTKEDFITLKNTLDEMNRLPKDDIKSFTKLDHTFHMNILSCAKNELCYKLLHTLETLIYGQLEEIDQTLTYEEKENALKKHNLIYQAIINRDAKLAREIMKEHLDHAYGVIEKLPDAFSNHIKSL
ncbi:FadR family transcriptional regulator [Crassaminicella thermophila]|uniref:FadR family transcriptional regulator n=1 Tax=Crassaminicella thermophila TaxID=2599308 RepID=A0A5C0SEZ7_CRATE|nr:FadR/GntR family transcriptional regulator [Crassaminicella thermophila]QEK12911.1 FadR family transcriptional regulator [Crassaminicella thermophila]